MAVSLFLAACAAEPEKTGSPAVVEITEVFYGTNRDRIEQKGAAPRYGQDRGYYQLGVASVHGMPAEDKTRVDSVAPLPPGEFNSRLRAAVAAAPEPVVFVFVHGFLRSFGRVARSVAEFSANTRFVGVPVMWSWPSTSNPARYTVDETNMDWAMPDFARFLQNIFAESGAHKIHLVGHSLGGRALSKVVIYELLPANLDVSRVGQFVLLAPDIDQEIFRRQYAPALLAADLNLSLYTSANDKAMASARAVHGYPRAGDSAGGPLLVPGIETIDVTPANRSFLGHSYFGESDAVASDLGLLLNRGLPAAERPGMQFVETKSGEFWRLTPPE